MQVRKRDTGEIFAMKVLRKQAIIARKQVAHTRAEKSILQKLQHPFVVRLHYAFQTSEKLYMILDYVNGGELFFHLKKEGRFPEERVRFYAAEIISAISHLHCLGIVYRDLKPENILLSMAGHIQLTDFGLSKEINEDGTSTFCGTPEYLAPEVLKGQSHGHAVDWWSLGTLLYEMLTGLPPFYSQNINSMYQKILTNELRFPSHISADAKSLLSGLLTRDPEKRLGSGPEGGAAIKGHPWFRKFEWTRLDALGYEPPFKPKVTNAADTTQIDTLFTKEVAQDSQVNSSALSDAANRADDCFQGFTFVAAGPLAGVVAPEN
jgi:serine/threonine protein kinase